MDDSLLRNMKDNCVEEQLNVVPRGAIWLVVRVDSAGVHWMFSFSLLAVS